MTFDSILATKEMLKTTLAILLSSNELLRGSEYVRGKYNVCTYVLIDGDFSDMRVHMTQLSSNFHKNPHLSETCHFGLEKIQLIFNF